MSVIPMSDEVGDLFDKLVGEAKEARYGLLPLGHFTVADALSAMALVRHRRGVLKVDHDVLDWCTRTTSPRLRTLARNAAIGVSLLDHLERCLALTVCAALNPEESVEYPAACQGPRVGGTK